MIETGYYLKRAEVMKALANPYRLRMVDMLAGGELCVCEFNNSLEIDYSTISRHLTILRRAGIVSYRKSGKQVFYTLRVPCIMSLFKCFDEVIKMDVKEGNDYLISGNGA